MIAGLSRLDVAVLVAIALVGAVNLASPFTGDQALFSLGAREMGHGTVLYRGFWDVKQPGIFLFYLVGGALGGFNAVAIHTLELVALLGFAIVLQRAARRFVTLPWVASVLPVFVVGIYYAAARPLELTQVESLIGVPLFASAWFAIRALDAPGGSRARLVASGVAAGIAGALKLVCLPLVGPAWLIVVITLARREPRARVRVASTTSAWLLLGLAVPLGVMAAYVVAHGLSHEVLWTYFTYTPKTTRIAGRPLSRLVDSLARFAVLGAPALVLAAVGVGRTLRTGWDEWSLAFAGWIVLGVPIFLTQHWWAYQLALFFVPVGFFAVRGLDAIARSWHSLAPHVAALGVVVLVASVVPLGASFGARFVTAARHDFGITRTGRVALQNTEEPQYRTARAFARFVQENAPGRAPIYVLGNPIDLYETGRDQALPTNGWTAEQYDATVWHRITVGLDQARPPVLAVDDFSAGYIAHRSPATGTVIDRLYCAVRRVAGETWYVRRDAGGCRHG